MNNIECEIRAIIQKKDVPALRRKLKKQGKLIGKDHRLSVMLFRCDPEADLDLRIRITNGQCEMVMKRGDHHSSDRVETAQEIQPDQFVGMTKLFLQFDWNWSKVGARDSENYDLGHGVVATIASAGEYRYLELEKMANKKTLSKIQKELETIANELGVELIRTKDEYYTFCRRLTKEVDWQIKDRPVDYKKLKQQLRKYL